jgi:hypothetical protein
VQKDEEGQQETRDAEHHLQDDLKNFHEQPFWGAPMRSIGRASV